jgi:hypothetical protein
MNEKWSSGRLVNATRSQPPVEGPFNTAGSLDLEIVIQIDAGVDPARAFAIATQLATGMHSHDPGLALTYDPARSRVEEGRVVIVLTPSRPGPDSVARLEKIAEGVRKAAAAAVGIALKGVRVLRAA